MKAVEAQLLAFLQKSQQLVIPIYQRTYSWTEEECQQLWNDILRAGADDKIKAHFIGSVVYVEDGIYQVSANHPLLVIDGQQRLTTVTLLLAALAERLAALPDDEQEPVDGFSPDKIRGYYLTNPLEKGDKRFKLLLSQTDKDTLTAVVAGKPYPTESSHRVKENFERFREWLAPSKAEKKDDSKPENKVDLKVVCAGLKKLLIVDVALTRGQDNPQLIFESMNSTGKELSQADLIRNFVLMGLAPDLQTELYQDHWRPMELAFGQRAYGESFDRFVRDFLTIRLREVPNINRVYEAFKAHARDLGGTSPELLAGIVRKLLADLHRFATYYCRMALGAEKDPDLAKAFHDLRDVDVEIAYPFLLEVYADFEDKCLPKADFVAVVRLVESYVFRRAVCQIPPNSMNKTFAGLGRLIDKSRYLESVQAQLQLLTSQRRFPRDEEFIDGIKTRDLYRFLRAKYWLRKLENHNRKEPISVDSYTIEHIMPQTLTAEWRTDLGPDHERIHATYLHRFGNLTLTGYNATYSNRRFVEKRDIDGGFKHSPLKLNAKLGELDAWNADTIEARAERLAAQAIEVWSGPSLSPTKLDEYRSKPKSSSTAWTLEDHAHLGAGGPARALFDALRAEVLALDEDMSEEFLKYYVAYRVESKVLVIVPQAKRLRLELSIPLTELDAPGVGCAELGHHRVSTVFDKLEDLPTVMALVRQAYEYQLAD